MKAFHYRLKNRERSADAVKYHAIVYMRGLSAYRLALHREIVDTIPERKRRWAVSDPVSGALVLRVTSTYKGMPVSSASLTIAQAREFALADLDRLVDRVGLDQFESVMGNTEARVRALMANERVAA